MRTRDEADTAGRGASIATDAANISGDRCGSARDRVRSCAMGVWGQKLLEVMDGYPLAPELTQSGRFLRIFLDNGTSRPRS
jgi:hypothetical protein